MTQEQLAEQANLHPTYVGSIERRGRNIALENIIALATESEGARLFL
jgi:hypothetical protein